MSLRLAPTCATCGSLNCKFVHVKLADTLAAGAEWLCDPCRHRYELQLDDLVALGVNKVLALEVIADRIGSAKQQQPSVAR